MDVSRGSSGILKAVVARVQVRQRVLQLFGVLAHGAEFIKQELAPVQPAANLPENRRPGRVSRISTQ